MPNLDVGVEFEVVDDLVIVVVVVVELEVLNWLKEGDGIVD